MIPLAVPDLRGNEARYLAECVADNWVSSAGPFVTAMEERMKALTGRRHAVATVNGTAALYLALVAAGVERGDLVVVPDYTFAATANAVIHAGATPLFVDVMAADWTLDPALLEQALTQHGTRVGAVLAVDVLGNLPDYERLEAICEAADIPLVEDAAGAIGAVRDGRAAGAFGRAATFSFNGNKTVTAGGGGMIVTDDAALAERARHLSTQARAGADYRYDAVGFNLRMTNLNAAVGLAQLERMAEMIAAKRDIARRYAKAVSNRSDMRFMPVRDWAECSVWMASVVVATPAEAKALVAHLEGREVAARSFWWALSDQPPYAGSPRLSNGVAQSLGGRVVSLPSSSHLTADELDRVVTALGEWRGRSLAEAMRTRMATDGASARTAAAFARQSSNDKV